MNIVQFVPSFFPAIGGREIVVHYLAKSLIALGHIVRIVGPGGFFAYSKYKFNYPVHRFPAYKTLFGDYAQVFNLALDILFFGCDVIHSHSTYPTGYYAALFKSIRDVPLVVTPHGEDIHVVPELKFGQRLDPIQRPKIDYAIREANVLTAISRSVMNSLLEAGADERKIATVPNGVDLDRFNAVHRVDVRSWLGLAQCSRIILTVGNYHPRKGHEVLIRSLPAILAGEPNARLVIVGRGSGELLPLIRELRLEGKVVLTGPIIPKVVLPISGRRSIGEDHVDWIAALYQQSDIYVSSAINEGAEGLSLAVLDAMASGLPIVASDISGNRDVVIDGKTGLLVAPSDQDELAYASLRLLSSPSLR